MPECVNKYVESARCYPLPPELEKHLPVQEGQPVPEWSAFEATRKERPRWSETGLRRRLNAKLAAAQQARQPGYKPMAPLSQSDDPEALVKDYLQVMR